MIKFKKIKIDRYNKVFYNIQYLENIYNLIKKYNNYLYYYTSDLFEEVINLIIQTSPFFWIILKKEELAVFVYTQIT